MQTFLNDFYSINLAGALSIDRYSDIQAQFTVALESRQHVLLDLSAVPFCDSTFLSELTLLRQCLTADALRLALVLLRGTLFDILILARNTALVETYDDAELAARSLRTPRRVATG